MKKLLLPVLLLLGCSFAMADDAEFDHIQPSQWNDILKGASAAYDKQDYAKAFELNARAACAGDKTSQAILGRQYLLGQGTEKDPVTGYAWIRFAADFPFPDFTSLARKLEDAMTPEQRKEGNSKAEALRQTYGPAVTNISCHGTSRRGVYLIDSVTCSPAVGGSGELLLRKCLNLKTAQ